MLGFFWSLLLPASSAWEEVPGYPTICSDYTPCYGANTQEILDCLGVLGHKRWLTHFALADGSQTDLYYYVLHGDTVAAGQRYARVVTPAGDTLLYRQAGDRVYHVPAGSTREVLLFDYGLQPGEVFAAPDGERWVVTELPRCEFQQGWGWRFGPRATFTGSEPPKILKLKSEDGQFEDLWVQGVGSARWGILPLSEARGLKAFSAVPVHARLVHAPGFGMETCWAIDEDHYKLAYLSLGSASVEARELLDAPWRFSFEGDTLCVFGWQSLNCLETYAACVITGGDVEVRVEQLSTWGGEPDCLGARVVEARIPGFKAGVYRVGRPGQERVSLVCSGASALESVRPPHTEFVTYDLNGRPVRPPFRGIAVSGGRKVLNR